MKMLRTIICLTVCMFFVPMSVLAYDTQSVTHEEALYRLILRNMSKIYLEKSIWPNIEEIGKKARQKAEFLINNIGILIAEMASQKIGHKNYQIQYFLNKKFHNYLKTCECS